MDFSVISKLADAGVLFCGTSQGMTRSDWMTWQNLATNDKSTLKSWLDQDYSLVAVAKHGKQFMVDIDDQERCLKLGFKAEWLDGYFLTDTPSGGQHAYGLHDVETESLGNLVVVRWIRNDSKSPKLLELKLNNQSVAAPTAQRLGQPKKVDGIYKPRSAFAGLKKGLNPEFVAWLRTYGDSPKVQSKRDWQGDFHPDFDIDEFLENDDCTEHSSGEVNGAFHVVVDACPHCGVEARESTLAAGVTKFIFGGRSFGFICHACGVDSRDEHVRRMDEEYIDYEPWDQYIYQQDDQQLVEMEILNDKVWLTEEASAGPDNVAPGVFASVSPVESQLEPVVPPKSQAADYTYSLDDTGNAERLVRLFGENIRFVYETSDWMVWTNDGWRKDIDGKLLRMSKHVIHELVAEAQELAASAIGEDGEVDEKKEDAADALAKFARKSAQKERRKAMIDLAAVEKGVVTNFNDWDSDDWLFNCANGTLELKTQTFRERRKSDMCSKMSPVVYDPAATCPIFDKFILQCMCGDQEMVNFLQEAIGMSLTGDTSQQAVFMNIGGGQNGKGTFMEIFRYICGEGQYCKDIDFTAFVADKGGHKASHRSDIAAIRGYRFVTATESSDGHMLDEELIKHITGREPITVREIYAKPITFVPKLKLWFQSNYEPIIKGQDKGIWRRIKRIMWDYEVPDEALDFELPSKLESEAAGVLNWALAGLARYVERGRLSYSEKIDAATDLYRDEMDILGRFVNERLEFRPGASALGAHIYQRYTDWCKDNGHYAQNSRRFYAEFRKRFGTNATEKKSKYGSRFEGVSLAGWDCPFPGVEAFGE
jgi:putative DNA primase/helicase